MPLELSRLGRYLNRCLRHEFPLKPWPLCSRECSLCSSPSPDFSLHWEHSHQELPACLLTALHSPEWKEKVKMKALVTQSCPTLCNSTHYSPPGSSVHGFSRQEYWSGLPFPSPGDFPDPGIEPGVSCTAGRFFTIWATREAPSLTTPSPYWPKPAWNAPSLRKSSQSQWSYSFSNHISFGNSPAHLSDPSWGWLSLSLGRNRPWPWGYTGGAWSFPAGGRRMLRGDWATSGHIHASLNPDPFQRLLSCPFSGPSCPWALYAYRTYLDLQVGHKLPPTEVECSSWKIHSVLSGPSAVHTVSVPPVLGNWVRTVAQPDLPWKRAEV